MAENSKIEWCHHTANLWWGCTEVHAGCDNCYARVLSHRWGHEVWGNSVPRREVKSVWKDLARYQKMAAAAGEMHRVFVGSMMDIFEKPMPVVNSDGGAVMFDGKWIDTEFLRYVLFENIDNGDYNNLMFLFLTKRPSNISKYIPKSWVLKPPPNVMFGTSPVDQATADKLCPQLINSISDGNGQFFLSVEPQLNWVNLSEYLYSRYIMGGARPMYNQINWVICGGESGTKKRPFDANWARKIRNDCKGAGVPFFMKQMDKVQPIPEDLLIRQFPG
jgi:protein gp37